MTNTAPSQPNIEEAIIKNQQVLMSVVNEMREEPLPPSEQPKDVSPLQKIEYPASGGIHTYMVGHSAPYKGFPFYEFVDKIDLCKKLARGLVSGLYHELKSKPKLWFLLVAPALLILKPFVRAAIYSCHRLISRSKIKPKYYSTSVAELYRVLSIEWHGESESDKKLRECIRDISCMILEFDNAYRFRFQDTLTLLDKSALKKNPPREIERLFELLSDRELAQDLKDTWTLGRLVVSLYLRFDKRLMTIITDAFLKLDMEKIGLSLEDKYFCTNRSDIKMRFLDILDLPEDSLTKEQKLDLYVIRDAQLGKEFTEKNADIQFNLQREVREANEKKEPSESIKRVEDKYRAMFEDLDKDIAERRKQLDYLIK